MERFKIHRKQNDHEATPDKVDSSLIEQATSGQGQPLDESTRALLEPKFGHSFGNIRIFADDHAAKSAQALHANAYTVGSNIVFNAGRYQPDSSDGQRLIAHELTHTVQQGGVDGNQSLPSELEVNEPEDSYEQAAEQMAENVTASSASSSAKTISSGDDGMVQRDTLAEDTSILNQSKIVPVSMPRIPSLDSTQTSVQREPKKFTPIDPALRGDPVTKKVAQEQLLEWNQ